MEKEPKLSIDTELDTKIEERVRKLENTIPKIGADVKKLIEKRLEEKRNDERIRVQGEKLHTLEAELMQLMGKPEKKWSAYELYPNIPKDFLQQKVSEVVFQARMSVGDFIYDCFDREKELGLVELKPLHKFPDGYVYLG
jgi:hypothetical protein